MSNVPKLSVIICTHNPRPDYLRRVLDALKAQTLPKEHWELLLIDNASKELLAKVWDLSWHPQGRHIREDDLGLTPARVRAIKESNGELLVFVDDDNVLATNYLAEAEAISETWPMLGAWGGQCCGAFDSPPPNWTRQYWGMIAIRTIDRNSWSNQMDDNSLPFGAGMCIRRAVGLEYAKIARRDTVRALLGRRGESLMAGEDTDIAMLSCQLGFGTGVFHSLFLTHLIPDVRLTEKYLTRLCEGMDYSQTLLQAIYGIKRAEPTFARKFVNLVYAVFSSRRKRRFRLASLRGERMARRFLEAHRSLFG